MAVTTTPSRPSLPELELTRPPFGLPPGSVRGIMSVLICAFFWIVLLLPADYTVKVVLGHFFLLGLVLMAFASHPLADRDDHSPPFLPWLLRVLFVVGSGAVVAVAAFRDLPLLQYRLTPDVEEVRMWWIPFLGTMGGGFAFGLFLRFVLGRSNHVFRTVRAWLGVVGSVMLAVEIGLFLSAVTGTAPQLAEFLHYWQCVEMVVVSAYFGSRA